MLLIKTLPFDISVCQLKSDIELGKLSGFYCFARTHNEISLVCQTIEVPDEILKREDGWSAFYIDASLDFSLVGIMARISSLLAQTGISLFAISTFNTDYFLVKKEVFSKALGTLEQAGYAVSLNNQALYLLKS